MNDVLDPDLATRLDRLILCLMLFALAGVLTGAMGFQYIDGEIPCPLCLLERVAMFACCFGLIWQLRDGGSQRGAGIAMLSAELLLVISVRQTLLDIVPRPGHAYIGSAVFGLHMAVWSVFFAVALLIGLAARLSVLGGPRWTSSAGRSTLPRVSTGLGLYVAILCALSFVSVLVQCGFGQCHTTGYALLR